MKERLEIIDEIINGSSTRLREGYFSKKYTNVYNDIINYCANIGDLPFKQKIWHWVNNEPNYIKCICGKDVSFHKNWIDGYRKGCSSKCTQSNIETKLKRKNTLIDKYGVDNVSKLESTKRKIEETNLRVYGTKSTFQNPEVREKWKLTIRNKYGVDHYFQTDQFKAQAKKYYLEKYGVDNQSEVEEIKHKRKNTCYEKYGVETYLNTDHARSSIKKYNRSSYEDEILDWLRSVYTSGDIIQSERSLINPLLIDIYLPSAKLAIEFNGLYWHSEAFKDKTYHLDKTLKCREKNVHLIHIWEDDWLNRKDILKSNICNKLDILSDRIYARKCVVKNVNNEDTSKFLNKNHIQGYAKFSNSIGLYYNDELVSLMTFGWRSINGKKEYELIRFCNKLNTIVIGAASKLFSYFIKHNTDINSITSFADRSIFNGSIYNTLGFKFIHKTSPNYWWVVDGVRRHRFTYNKKKLVKQGYDPLKTEVEIMHERGYYRIYGCGQDKWVWYRS